MASTPPSLKPHGLLYLNILICSFFCIGVSHPFLAIFNFGDSLSDTKNLIHMNFTPVIGRIDRFPYRETYFKRPTGRSSDGRVVIDFLMEAFGHPYLPPYLAGPNGAYFRGGVNFAIAGATVALKSNNMSGNQLRWFETLKPSLCGVEQDCIKYMSKSLFVLGEISGNDYNIPFSQGASLEEILKTVPKVIETVSSAAKVLIRHGARKMVMPNLILLGCTAISLTLLSKPNETGYDPLNGCLKRYNDMSMYHNKLLKEAVKQLRIDHPKVKIVYADWYGASIRLYNSPRLFGFTESLKACCGGEGPYNFSPSVLCGGTVSVGSILNDPFFG